MIDSFDLFKQRLPPSSTFLSAPSIAGKLSFAWWNVGVSPNKGESDKVDRDVVVDKIVDLARECNLVGLGEFADDALAKRIQNILPRPKRVVTISEDKDQRVRFNTAFIYDEDKFTYDTTLDPRETNCFEMDGSVTQGQYRVYQKIRLRYPQLDGLFDVYFVHWRMHDAPYDVELKRKAASRIHEDSFGRYGEYKKSAATIVMGDFNVEPHEEVFSQLSVSRSSAFVKKYGGLFNPFWRRLHDECWTMNGKNTSQLRVERCVFDYIMIGPAFVALPEFKCFDKIKGESFYAPPEMEHRPVIVNISWQKG